jgi:histone H3/H4
MVPSEEQLFFTLMQGIVDASRDDTGPLRLRWKEQRPDYDSLDMARDLTVVLEELQARHNKPVRLVVLMDEGDRMNSFDQHIQGALRGLLMRFPRRILLVWSGQALNRDWHLETSPWYNVFKREIHLGAFSEGEEAEVMRLIQEPVRGLLDYDDEAVTQILAYTGCKPEAIQRLCSKAVRQALNAGRRRIIVEDVHHAHQLLAEEDATRAAAEREPTV